MIAGGILWFGDWFHVASNTARYADGEGRFFNLPWWVWPEFSLATFILIVSYAFRKKLFRFEDQIPTDFGIILSGFLTLMVYLLSSWISELTPLLKSVLLYSIVLIQLIWLKMLTKGSMMDLLQVTILGCAFEWFLGERGIFTYSPSPSRFLVNTLPVWLPAIYLSAGASARLMAVKLQSKTK